MNDVKLTLQEPKGIKYLAFVLLLVICLYSIYLTVFTHFIFLFFTIAALVGISFIKFKVLKLNSDSIELEYKGIVKPLDRTESIQFKDIQDLKFRKGQVDKKFILVDVFMDTFIFRGNTKPTYILIQMKSQKEKLIMKVGAPNAFEHFYSESKEQFIKQNN